MILVALVVLGAVMVVGYLRWLDSWGGMGIDFRTTTWEPGKAILEGRSPYPDPETVRLGSGPAAYPAIYMLLFAPFSLLSFHVALGLWHAALTGSILAALWVVGLRDIRCYAIALLSLPAASAIGGGNATALLLLSTALLWRWRDRPHHGAAAFACALLIKPILWPLFIWLLVTRRFRLALEAAVLTPVIALAGWAVIGFDGLAKYPALLRAVSDANASNGLLTTNLLLDAGLPLRGAEFASLVVGACLLTGLIWVRGDLERFTIVVAAALIMTPVMWVHYFILLYIPLAIRYPRLSPSWLAPMALWPLAFAWESDATRPPWASVVGLFVAVAILASVAGRATRVEPAGRTASA